MAYYYGNMRKHTSELEEVGESQQIEFISTYVKMGPRLAIYVPKKYHEQVTQLDNPLRIIVAEAL